MNIDNLYCPKCSNNSLFNPSKNVMIEQVAWIDNISIKYYVCTNCGYLDVNEEFRKEVKEFEKEHWRGQGL